MKPKQMPKYLEYPLTALVTICIAAMVLAIIFEDVEYFLYELLDTDTEHLIMDLWFICMGGVCVVVVIGWITDFIKKL